MRTLLLEVAVLSSPPSLLLLLSLYGVISVLFFRGVELKTMVGMYRISDASFHWRGHHERIPVGITI